MSVVGNIIQHFGVSLVFPVFEIKALFCAPLGCTHIDTVRPEIFLCTPLVYWNENRVKKCAHIGRTRPKNVRPAAEMCAPGAECTLNFEHCFLSLMQCSKLTVHSAPDHTFTRPDARFSDMCAHFVTQFSLQYTRGVHRKIPRRTVSTCVHPRGAQNRTLISNTAYDKKDNTLKLNFMEK